MTCLKIVQNAADEVSVDAPSSVFGNSDPNAATLLRFAQKAGENIAKRHDWSRLTIQHTFTSVATEPQPAAFPSDFDRMNYMSDVWDRTRNLRYIGPTNINDWQYLKNGVVTGASGIIGYWRILGGVLNLFPAPPAGNTIALEYITKSWATDANGIPRTSQGGGFEADADLALIPERLITMEVIWRFKRRAGLSYSEEMSDAERALELDASRDQGLGVVAVGGSGWDTAAAARTWPGVILP